MLGYWNYTVYATYASALSALLGMVFCLCARPYAALFCLLACGGLDMVDGRIARMKRDRSRDEKRYGVQLDSLADLLAFGALPALIAISDGLYTPYGLGRWWQIGVALLFALCCLIRLAFFNVRSAADEGRSDAGSLAFKGLPAPAIVPLFALVYCLRPLLAPAAFSTTLTLLLALVGLAYVTPFTLKKPGPRLLIPLAAVCLIILVALILIPKNI